MFQLKHTFFLGCFALILATPTSFRYFNLSKDKAVNKTGLIKVTSYNCMLFDQYNWKHSKKTRPQIYSYLLENDPGILCLQEFYTSENKKDVNNIDSVTKYFHLPENHIEYAYTQDSTDHWGIATFSKYPIINRGLIKFKTISNNSCIFTDVVIKTDTIRIYNVHFQSISFSDDDNKFLEEVIGEKDAENELEKSKSILRRLKRAFTKRAKQAKIVKDHMKKCRYKIILCGDFNDTASSYAYETVSDELEDAFLEKGTGIGRTYAGKWPQFRIDYILHSKELKCLKFKQNAETLTDHYPLTAFFEQ